MAKIKHATLIEEFEDTKWVASDYPFGIFKLLYQCGMFYFGHCVLCPSLIYSFRLPIWYLQTLLSMWHVLFWPFTMAKIKHATLIEEFEDTKWVI
jgi:hypothetical protein